MLTLEDPAARASDRLRFTSGKGPAPDHLVLAFEDCDTDALGYRVMTAPQMEQVLAFGRTHQDHSLLVHCFHGVGRSAGCALAILADRLGPEHEDTAVEQLFMLRPEAAPNLVTVGLADLLLGRDGTLTYALYAYEQGWASRVAARQQRHAFAVANPSLYARAE